MTRPAGLRPTSAPPGPLADGEALERIADFVRAVTAQEGFEPRLRLDGASGEAAAAVHALNTLLDKLWARAFEVEAEHDLLEKRVEIRAREVREILDNVRAGFLIVLRDGTVLGNYSHSCENIFQTRQIAGRALPDLMRLGESPRAELLLSLDQVFADVLPIELTLAQIPGDFTVGERAYHADAAPLMSADGSVGRLFLTVTETTDLRQAERENRLRRALLEILSQRDGFVSVLRDFERSARAARADADPLQIRAVLHTLKGNLGCFGLVDLAAFVHALEDRAQVTVADLDDVQGVITQFVAEHEDVLRLPATGCAPAAPEGFAAALRELAEEPSIEARRRLATRHLRRLSWVRVVDLLPTLPAMVERTAERAGVEVRFSLDGGDLLVDPEALGPVLGMVPHLVRNAVMHGIEPSPGRGGKPRAGRIEVAVRDTDDGWVLTVADDGRGINVEVLAELAVASGACTRAEVEAMGEAARLELVFVAGLSSAPSVSMDAGRGIGAGAFRSAVVAAGGRVTVSSTRGQGTRFVATIPHAA